MPIVQRSSMAKVKGVADIVFLFDCTGSMEPYIENVKNNVTSLIDGFNATPNVKLDWRVRAMGYKDFFEDEDYLIDGFDFTDSLDVFANNQLARLQADGGGDEKESTLDAIWYAIKKSDWRPKCTKVIVVFTDAGTKGLHERTMDDLCVVDGVEYLMQELQKNRIYLFMYCKKDPDYDAISKIERTEVHQYNELKELLPKEEESKNEKFKSLLEKIGKTVSASINTENKTL